MTELKTAHVRLTQSDLRYMIWRRQLDAKRRDARRLVAATTFQKDSFNNFQNAAAFLKYVLLLCMSSPQ